MEIRMSQLPDLPTSEMKETAKYIRDVGELLNYAELKGRHCRANEAVELVWELPNITVYFLTVFLG